MSNKFRVDERVMVVGPNGGENRLGVVDGWTGTIREERHPVYVVEIDANGRRYVYGRHDLQPLASGDEDGGRG